MVSLGPNELIYIIHFCSQIIGTEHGSITAKFQNDLAIEK